MQSKSLRILAIIWLGWWFGMFLPGHQRGSVQLPGSGGKPQLSSCCPSEVTEAPSCHAVPTKQNDSEDDSSDGSPSNCALCQIINTLSTPPTVLGSVEPLGLLTVLNDPAGSTRPMSRSVRLALGRAPPTFLIFC